MYYIYHIPERKKIGVSDNLTARMKKHKWNGFFEILECHTDIYKVSDRELELQKEYGYPVDKRKYWQTINVISNKGRTKGGNWHKGKKHEWAKKSRKLTYDDAQQIRAEYALGSINQSQLARMYGVFPATINGIVNNKIYVTP